MLIRLQEHGYVTVLNVIGTTTNVTLLFFIFIFATFLAPGSGSGFPIRIQRPDWIRIQSRKSGSGSETLHNSNIFLYYRWHCYFSCGACTIASWRSASSRGPSSWLQPLQEWKTLLEEKVHASNKYFTLLIVGHGWLINWFSTFRVAFSSRAVDPHSILRIQLLFYCGSESCSSLMPIRIELKKLCK